MESKFTVAETLDGVYSTLEFWIILLCLQERKNMMTALNYFVTLHKTQNKQRSEPNGSQKR
jgi:hypothetical protein